MYTDPNRIRANLPCKVEAHPVFTFHDAFNSNKNEVLELKEDISKGISW